MSYVVWGFFFWFLESFRFWIFQEVGRRYQAMLQMYGEKVEELQELRLDFEDMKALYRTQIDALTQKSWLESA